MDDQILDNMTQEAVESLSLEEVFNLLKIVEPHKALVVGGQSLRLWAKELSGKNDWLAENALHTEDMDFLYNKSAAAAIATAVGVEVLKPKTDDQTVSAAKIEAPMSGRTVTIDFMRSLQGVPDATRASVNINIEGPTGDIVKVCIMHPIDCMISRFANMNSFMGRISSEHARKQAQGSIAIIDAYIEKSLEDGNTRAAQNTMQAVEFIIRDNHQGSPSHTKFGHDFPIIELLKERVNDERLHPSWREKNLVPMIERIEDRMKRWEERAVARGEMGDGYMYVVESPRTCPEKIVTPLAERLKERIRAARMPEAADPVPEVSSERAMR